MRRVFPAIALVVLVVVIGARPASGHASLTGTEPAAATAVPEPPKQVVLRFTEPVEASFGAVRVFDARGRRVATGPPSHPDGQDNAVAADLPELTGGLYMVTWRVVSADSHPVQGAFTFRIGPAQPGGQDHPAVGPLLAASEGSPLVGAMFTTSRFAVFASLVLLVGGITFAVVVWPAGTRNRRFERLLAVAWVTAVTFTAAGIGFQGAYAAALPLGDAFRPAVLSTVLETRFGQMSFVRLVLLLAAVPLWRLVRSSLIADPRPAILRPAASAAVLLGAGILLTLGLSGHAGVGDLIAVAALSDVLHTAAVSTWLGGLVVLTLCALPRADADELATVVPRFSTLAFTSVVVIVATGSFQSWRQVGSIDALTGTTYGRLLITKVALFAAMVSLGALSRAWVRRRYRSPVVAMPAGPGAVLVEAPAVKVARLRRSVGAEVVVAVAVLGVTALLVNAPPARSSLAKPFSTSVEAKGLLVNLTVDPAKAGPAVIHVHTQTPEGQMIDVENVEGLLRLDAEQIGPLKVAMHRMGPGQFAAHGFEFPLAGTWKIEVIILRSRLDQVRAVATVPVR